MPIRYRKPLALALFLVVLGMVAVACGAEAPAGDCLKPEDGKFVPSNCDLPEGVTPDPTATPTPTTAGGEEDPAVALMKQYTCNGCHTIDGVPGMGGQVGPNLTHVGSKGADYIHQSIVDPSAVIADQCPGGPCPDNVMPKTFGTVIPEEDLNTIVEYLSSLE